MPQQSTHLSIDAPADLVWQVIGPGFAHIGEWATGVLAFMPVPAVPESGVAATPAVGSAPVAGRTCATGIRLVPQITETLVAFDESSRTLTYEAGGLQVFITTARSTWTVIPAGESSCRVTVSAHLQTRGMLGLLGPGWLSPRPGSPPAVWKLTSRRGRSRRPARRHVRNHRAMAISLTPRWIGCRSPTC
jgi:Polyketide cyclase / dehydrase and lipid transport